MVHAPNGTRSGPLSDELSDAQEDINADGLIGPAETDPDDSDDDGTDDYTELRLNLDPRSATERFIAQMDTMNTSSLLFKWPSAPGTYFDLLTTTNLTTAPEHWRVAATNIPADSVSSETSKSIEFSDDAAAFFRLELRAE